LWGGPLPLPDGRDLIEKVIDECVATNWGRTHRGVALHV
jgi:hypothetical protein